MVESLEYKTLKRFGDLEVRRYPRTVLATVKDKEDDESFGLLFAYIGGSNSGGRKIPMTAPVLSSAFEMETASEQSPGARPGRRFSFALPAAMAPESVPSPTSAKVEIEEIPGRFIAVLRFSGRSRPRDVRLMVQKLQFAVRYAGLTPKGPPFLMRYNSPFMPGFLRRNEIAFEIADPS
jgi:hypothetical protein